MIARVESQGANWTWYGVAYGDATNGLVPVDLRYKDNYGLLPYANSGFAWSFYRNNLSIQGSDPYERPDLVYCTGPVSTNKSKMTTWRLPYNSSSSSPSITNGFYGQFYDTRTGKLHWFICPKSYTGSVVRQYRRPVYPKGGIEYSVIDCYHDITTDSGFISGGTIHPSFIYLENPGYASQLYGRYYSYMVTMILKFKNAKLSNLSYLDIVIPYCSMEEYNTDINIQIRNIFGVTSSGDNPPEFFHSKDGDMTHSGTGSVNWKVRSSSDMKTIFVSCCIFDYINVWCGPDALLKGSGVFMTPIITFRQDGIVWDHPEDNPTLELTETHIETAEGWPDVL